MQINSLPTFFSHFFLQAGDCLDQLYRWLGADSFHQFSQFVLKKNDNLEKIEFLGNTTGRQHKTLFRSVFSTISYKNGLFHFIPYIWSCNSDSCDFFYNRGWFIIDLVAAIPFDLLLFGSDTDEVAINIKFTITKTRNMDF